MVLPFTVKLPVITTFPLAVTVDAVISSVFKVPDAVMLLNVTLSLVPTAWPISIVGVAPSPELSVIVTPVPATNDST